MLGSDGAGGGVEVSLPAWWTVSCCLLATILAGTGIAQSVRATPSTFLDPARDPSILQPSKASTLTEQFIWTRGDAAALNPAYQSTVRGQNDKVAPHYFRAHFQVEAVPKQATLYIAGPRSATVMLNGIKVLQFADGDASGKGFHVVSADVAAALRPGQNVIAIQEVRGHNSLHTGAGPIINQVTYGEVLAVKIVPSGVAVDSPAILVSDGFWRSSLDATPNWSSTGFNDSSWPNVQTLGVLGSRNDFLQWNADAGLYAWPGYVGISSALRTFRLLPVSLRDLTQSASLRNTGVLLQSTHSSRGVFTVTPQTGGTPTALTLDFGKEVSGRIHLVSASDQTVTVDVSYGESAEEALAHPYLGVRPIVVPAHGEAFGPKSGFRYGRLTFRANEPSAWSSVDVEGIAYPVEYLGSFESSDPLLNRIWETGAYTAHLCMQEGIWDGVKRDRGRWMGDLDVTGRVVSSVFADRNLMESTMAAVIGESPVQRDVNTIAGYSALWITGQADFYRHSGDLDYLRRMHRPLLELLQVMDGELDPNGLFTNREQHKVFVDWSDGFSSDTAEARAATHLEFTLAYREAAYLLRETGDIGDATAYRAKADRLQQAAQNNLLDPATDTFGSRWQTNAMAVLSGAATAEEQQEIWSKVLSQVVPSTAPGTRIAPETTVTPYYGFYVLSAMARLGHRPEALAWMRQYWGGMLTEGATSFWEAYDPRWPKQDFHAYLEADGKRGTYVSLAHGWASGPTAWLMQQVLGIEPTAAGFQQVTIRPDLAGLAWARGAEPTPRGPIQVDIRPNIVRVVIPKDTVATMVLPFPMGRGTLLQNGRPVSAVGTEEGSRSILILHNAGEYAFALRGGPK